MIIAPGEASDRVDSIETTRGSGSGSGSGSGENILDFDTAGRLLGIEVSNAQDVVPAAVIQNVTPTH